MVRVLPILNMPMIRFGLLLSSAMALTGCDNSIADNKSPNSPVPQESPETICLGRVLLDLPGPVEIGHTSAGMSNLSVAGLRSRSYVYGHRGIKWGELKVAEFEPMDKAGFERIYSFARGETQTEQVGNKGGIETARSSIAYHRQQLSTGTSGDVAVTRRFIEEDEELIRRNTARLAASGEANVASSAAFAIRSPKQFRGGYLDLNDNRPRYFEVPVEPSSQGGPPAAAAQWQRVRGMYSRRDVAQIPTSPGMCTAFGFIHESSQSEFDTRFDLPFRSLKFPNLLFTLTIEPSSLMGEQDNIQKLPGMGLEHAGLDASPNAKIIGPKAVDILGSPGRVLGMVEPLMCTRSTQESCVPPRAAYAMQAATFGRQRRLDQPYLVLHMMALLPQDELRIRQASLAAAASASSGAALGAGDTGQEPPPFKEGKAIFEAVLKSIRLRPNGIAGSPEIAASAASSSAPSTSH